MVELKIEMEKKDIEERNKKKNITEISAKHRERYTTAIFLSQLFPYHLNVVHTAIAKFSIVSIHIFVTLFVYSRKCVIHTYTQQARARARAHARV